VGPRATSGLAVVACSIASDDTPQAMALSVTFDSLVVTEEDGITCVRMNHPPANALSPDLLADGTKLLELLHQEPPAAVVITGTDRFFSGGVDLKIAPTLDAEGQGRMVDGINRLFAGWYAMTCPVVAAVNGHAVAGGLILALCAEVRIGARGASYGLTEAKVGIPYPAAAMLTVKAELDPGVARRLVLEAELIDAERALELGVFDELAAPEEVMIRAMQHAAALAAMPRRAYAEVKRQLRGTTIEAMRTAIENDPMAAGWTSDETAEAVRSVLEGPRPG
jgi:enoyl-CoA hydratase